MDVGQNNGKKSCVLGKINGTTIISAGQSEGATYVSKLTEQSHNYKVTEQNNCCCAK
jgi:hypothetical protein